MPGYQEWINCTIAAINVAVAIANVISHKRYCRWSASLAARESALNSAITDSKCATCLRAKSGIGDARYAAESFSMGSPSVDGRVGASIVNQGGDSTIQAKAA